MTDPEPVDEVAHAPADEEPEGHREDRVAGARLREVKEHPDDRAGGQEGDGGGPAREEAECDPRVVHVPDPERPDDVDGLAEAQLRDDDLLRQLVGCERRERDRERVQASGTD